MDEFETGNPKSSLTLVFVISKPIKHPAAQALFWARSENSISKQWLKRSVEARIRDAQREVDDIPESIKELEKYAEDTVSILLYNTLHAGGISSTAAEHAASHIGVASGLVLILKSLPYHCSRNRHHNYIPMDLAEKHGLLVKQGGQSEILLDMDSREGLCNAVFEISCVASAHLLKACELAGKVHAGAKPVLLHSVPVQVLLDSLSKVYFDVFDPRMERGVLGVPPLWFQFKLKWYSWRSMF
ncbi:hypothetical protein N665_0090s0039 [Sinapis alba]|nr:hypothetical protein N665_0090s0039 [Sinapis alba]